MDWRKMLESWGLLGSLYRQHGEQTVKAGGLVQLFQPNVPIAIQEVIIIFESKVYYRDNKEERCFSANRKGVWNGL